MVQARRARSPSESDALRQFDQLYEATFPDVLAYCRRRTRSLHDAHDAVADVYVVAWRRLDDVLRAGRPVAWLIGVARGVLLNHQRSRGRGARLVERLVATRRERLGVDPADVAVGNDAVQAAYDALDTLAPADRELVTLAALEGLSYEEIGRVVGLRPQVVNSRLYRARRLLAAELAARGVREETP